MTTQIAHEIHTARICPRKNNTEEQYWIAFIKTGYHKLGAAQRLRRSIGVIGSLFGITACFGRRSGPSCIIAWQCVFVAILVI